jgi:CBS domain-containing protein/Zn-dependent protease
MRSIRLLGFRVLLAPAWLIGASLLVTSLVASLPLGLAPRLSAAGALIVAVLVAGLLAVVIVGLELLRALVARRRGVATDEIRILTLGLAPPRAVPPLSPGTEAIVAASAPLVGGVLGASLVLASQGLDGVAAEVVTAIDQALMWLGSGVLVVAAFMSLPLLPLDGGRLVRAVAWRLTGDLGRATALTAAIGRGFGYLVLGAGIITTFVGELLLGLWLLLLGWLATRVARGSADRARLEELTAGLVVGDALDTEPPSIGPSLTLDALLSLDEQADSMGVYPVVEDGRLGGVVFVRRVQRRARRRAAELRAADVMVPLDRLGAPRPGDPLLDAVIRLESGRVDALPVVADDDAARLVGLLTRDRVLERLRARQTLQAARTGQAGRAARG